jgi:hypothetical protein
VTDWDGVDLLNLLGVAPVWVDTTARLIPEWTTRGATARIVLDEEGYVPHQGNDHRIVPVDNVLCSVRDSVVKCATRADLLAAVASRFEPVSFSPAGERKEAGNLHETVDRWASNGAGILSDDSRALLERDALESLNILAKADRRLPFTRKPDEVALSLLAAAGDRLSPASLVRILPRDDNAAESYVSSMPSTSMLVAAMRLNSHLYRGRDIRLDAAKLPADLGRIAEMSKDDPDLLSGLTRSVEISSLGAGSLVRALLLCPDIDHGYLYLNVLPAASDGRADRLLSLVCINPKAFVSWIGAPEPYAGALIEGLKHETQQAIWKRISGLISRWKRPESDGARHRS